MEEGVTAGQSPSQGRVPRIPSRPMGIRESDVSQFNPPEGPVHPPQLVTSAEPYSSPSPRSGVPIPSLPKLDPNVWGSNASTLEPVSLTTTRCQQVLDVRTNLAYCLKYYRAFNYGLTPAEKRNIKNQMRASDVELERLSREVYKLTNDIYLQSRSKEDAFYKKNKSDYEKKTDQLVSLYNETFNLLERHQLRFRL